ncbi:MAG: ABC transporter permease, partial [Eubacterium sp.]|nr:ABC transporter permease [Eubacterium sp.]
MIRVRSQKIIAKLSKRSLQTNRVRNMVAVFAIALTTLLFTALFTITETMLYTSEQQTFRQVGSSFHGGFKNLTLEQKELLEQDDGIRESGSRLMLGRAAGEEFRKVHAEISYMDENYCKYSFCTPEYGAEPQEGTKQIACDTRALKCLGIEPEIGRKITMTYEIGGENKEEITDTFVLSGWWEFDAASSASMAIVSKSYVDAVVTEHPVDFTDDANATGTWSLDVFFDSSRHIEQDLLQILGSHGYQAEDRMKENYIGIGVNWGYTAAQMSEKYDVEMIVGSAVFIFLIVMTGYLIIYNIFQISVSGDIRFYG